MRRLLAGILVPITSHATTLAQNSALMSGGELLRVVGGLLIVVAAIVFLSWLLKRLNGGKFATTRGLKIIACMNLGTREKIMLINVANRFLLVGVTPGSINTLHDFGEDCPDGFSSEGSKASFSELLKSALGKS
ncbi:flagellar biosynthetic protein FliO [Legionella massiliensis]|nr:flagellar biosynthetic protein FliO [Legionella massiliensis]